MTNRRPANRGKYWLSVVLLWALFIPGALAVNSGDLLSNDEAFRLSQHLDREKNQAVFNWDIADGYHLYQKRLKFSSKTPGVELGLPDFPKGETKHDEAMGVLEVYRGHLEIRVPLLRKQPGLSDLKVEVSSQGCADAGVCYPPVKQLVALHWPENPVIVAANDTASSFKDVFKMLGLKPGGQGDLLPPDQAFRFHAEVRDHNHLWVGWQIADGYYLYREKIALTLQGAPGFKPGGFTIPHGEPKQDPEFGAVEVFHHDVGFMIPLQREHGNAGKLELQAGFQGCAERGVCYPPMQKSVALEVPAGEPGPVESAAPADAASLAGECSVGPPTGFVETEGLSEQCAIVDHLAKDSVWLTALSFLGMGILLAFTPCIFPMIPILSGIIVGHGHKITTGRAFMLSLSYVLASALAYTVFGVLAGLFGSNLQALFQDPRVIVAFSALFVVLALSMFDLFTLQVPGFIQDRIASLSNRQHGGTLLGAALMGALSALIVGPCVAAPLAGALIYIGQTGDALLGGLALFALGLGMGLPLLVIGTSAGRLLPRAGTWMNAVKAVFGVGLLAIAVWLLDRILPSAVTLLLWALLLIVPAIYLGALDALPQPASGWRKLWKGIGIVMLAYGLLLLVGVAANSTDPLQPLRGVVAASGSGKASTPRSALNFRPVSSVADLTKSLRDASDKGQFVMLDFYADWCVSCKEMERYTFSDEGVIDALRPILLLKADVTDNSDANAELMKHFGLIGPPATLFFNPEGEELKSLRVIGYMEADAFQAHIRKVIPR
jgi:thiol:disulfide interchange protein DsbD